MKVCWRDQSSRLSPLLSAFKSLPLSYDDLTGLQEQHTTIVVRRDRQREGFAMTRRWYRVVMLVWLCVMLLGHAARAELQPCVLVLPLQAGPEMSGDQVFLGLAVQNVLENVLAVHSTLEECWATWFLRQLFPHQQALHDWVHGTGGFPAAIPELGLRYLLTGQVRLQGKAVQVMVELLDRATDH